MTHNKLKTTNILKHDVYYTGIVTEGEQASNNLNRTMLLRRKKPLHQ
jgi:hypothetical protein